MCGRYARKSTAKVIAAWFGVDEDAEADLETEDGLDDALLLAPTYNAAPQSTQPVIRMSRDAVVRQIAPLRWGLVPFWARDAKFGYSTFNARGEEVPSKPAFREAFKKRRCLVPADAFYEWKKLSAKERSPLAFALDSGEPFAFAGLWERWKPAISGPDASEGEALETFTIITTTANELMAPVHDRIPVILQPRDYERWLDTGNPAQPPVDLLRPFAAEAMRAWPVSDRVGNVRNNEPALLEAVPADTASTTKPAKKAVPRTLSLFPED